MSVKLHVRGNALDAYYAAGKKGHAVQGGTDANIPIVDTAIAGVWEGKMLDMSQRKALSFSGGENWAIGVNTFTMHMRIVPHFTGAPVDFQCLFQAIASNYVYAGLIMGFDGAPFYAAAKNADGSDVFGGDFGGTLVDFVAGQALDVYLVSDGTHAKLYANAHGVVAALMTTLTFSAAAVRPDNLANNLAFGAFDFRHSDYDFVEGTVDDAAIDPIALGVRTGYLYTGPAGEGATTKNRYTDPGTGNVAVGTSYLYDNVTKNGGLAVNPPAPTAAEVAAAVRAEMDANSTKLALIPTLETETAAATRATAAHDDALALMDGIAATELETDAATRQADLLDAIAAIPTTSVPTPSEIAVAVVDQSLTSHTTYGTVGGQLMLAGTGGGSGTSDAALTGNVVPEPILTGELES